MKKKNVPFIVSLCLTVAFAIAAVLCFVIPVLTQPKDSPVEVSSKIRLSRTSVDGQFGYYLVGKIKNTSDKQISIKDDGGIKVYFDGSDDVATDWLEGTEYIILNPDDEFDLSVGTYYFSSSGVSVSKVTVEVNGTVYTIVGKAGGGIASILGLIFIIMTVVMIIVTITFAVGRKKMGQRETALNAICSQLGEDGVVITGTYTDSTETKKAAAKTAGWVVGAFITTLFTGGGVYRVYSGTNQMEFILSNKCLYALKNGANVSAENLICIPRGEFNAESITVKKNKVIMKSSDKKQTFTFFANKKSDLTAEQIAERLNNIFVNPVAPEVTESAQPTEEDNSDPFEDLKPEVAAAEDGAEQNEVKEIAANDTATDENPDGAEK